MHSSGRREEEPQVRLTSERRSRDSFSKLGPLISIKGHKWEVELAFSFPEPRVAQFQTARRTGVPRAGEPNVGTAPDAEQGCCACPLLVAVRGGEGLQSAEPEASTAIVIIAHCHVFSKLLGQHLPSSPTRLAALRGQDLLAWLTIVFPQPGTS